MQRLSSDEALARLAESVDQDRDGVAIVAVDGHSAAGKSTFAARIAARFGAAVVEVDDFYRVLDLHVRDALDARAGVDQYYDWQRLRDVLTTIRAGQTAAFEPYDWERNTLSQSLKTIEAAHLAVVEGLFAARPELDDLIDISVLIESPPSTRQARQRQRGDATDDWLKRWDAAERLYLEVIRPATSFDLVVSSS
jgi:uridine kinase